MVILTCPPLRAQERYELPSLVNIGIAYDIVKNDNMVIEMNGQFTSNSFTKDQFGLCTEARFGTYLTLRAGYLYEAGILSDEDATTAYTGPSGGLGFQVPRWKLSTISHKHKPAVFARKHILH